MISFKNNNKNSVLPVFSALIFILSVFFVLPGCSSSSDPAIVPGPLPDQDASGLYKSGTGNLDGSPVDDIIAFVHNDRLMAFSVTAKILIDGSIDSVTEDEYTATVTVYKDGVMAQENVSVTGMVMNESQVSGTLNGTGVGSGDFSLTFDPLYSRGATSDRILTGLGNAFGDVFMDIPSMETTNFSMFLFNNIINYTLTTVNTSLNPIPRCDHDGTSVITDSTINIYTLQEVITQTQNCTISTSNYTGFAAVVDGVAEDDTILYAVSNGLNSVFSVITKL